MKLLTIFLICCLAQNITSLTVPSLVLRYFNGVLVPTRDIFYNTYTDRNYYDIEIVEDYERRIRDAISSGFITLPDGSRYDLTKPKSIEYLGNLIQVNGDSVSRRFYAYFIWMAKMLLGTIGAASTITESNS